MSEIITLNNKKYPESDQADTANASAEVTDLAEYKRQEDERMMGRHPAYRHAMGRVAMSEDRKARRFAMPRLVENTTENTED